MNKEQDENWADEQNDIKKIEDVLRERGNPSYIFTFQNDSIYRNCYVEIKGEYTQARAVMVRGFGMNWSRQYASKSAANVEENRLYEIGLDGRVL